MTSIILKDGTQQEVTVTLSDFKEADDKGLSIAAHINQKFDADTTYGTAFEQALASNEIFLKPNAKYGIKAPTMAQMMRENYDVNMGAINRNDGRDVWSPQGRIFFQAAMLELVTNQLMEDNGSYEANFNKLVAVTSSVDTPRFDQPEITLTAPMASRNQPISQFATPTSMVSISMSTNSYRIPTRSIGIEISDEAQKSVSIDILGMALKQQASAERAANCDAALYSMVAGDTDLGIAALSTSDTSQNYDAAISALSNVGTGTNTFTHKAWIKWLRKYWRKMNIDWVVCDLETYLRIEGRSGRPVYSTAGYNPLPEGYLNAGIAPANPNLPDSVNFFIVESDMLHDGGAYGSSTHPLGGTLRMLGIDSTKAIRRVVYSGASYSAIENFVLRKSSAMRFDYAENYYRMYKNGDGFRLLTI